MSSITRSLSSSDLPATVEDLKHWHQNSPIFNNGNVPEIKKASWIKRFFSKVWSVIKKCFKFIVACALFISNPAFFACGFLLGFAITAIKKKGSHGPIDKIIATVKNVWKKQKWYVLATLGVAAFLSLPITLAATSLCYGASKGAQLVNSTNSKS